MRVSTLHLGIFYMPQICGMRLRTLLFLRRNACWGFFRPEKSWQLRLGLNPWTWQHATPRPPKPLIRALVIEPFCGGQVCFCRLNLQLADRRASSHIYGLYCRVFGRLVIWLKYLEVPGDQFQLAYRRFTIFILEGGIPRYVNDGTASAFPIVWLS
jgi:hypothetical protein